MHYQAVQMIGWLEKLVFGKSVVERTWSVHNSTDIDYVMTGNNDAQQGGHGHGCYQGIS
jgi:hypothetical protein